MACAAWGALLICLNAAVVRVLDKGWESVALYKKLKRLSSLECAAAWSDCPFVRLIVRVKLIIEVSNCCSKSVGLTAEFKCRCCPILSMRYLKQKPTFQ